MQVTVSCCLTWIRWVRPPFGCKPRPFDWHQLTADSSSWPWQWHNTNALWDIWLLRWQTKLQEWCSKESVKKEWERSWEPSRDLTVPITDTSIQRSRYKKRWTSTSQPNSNCAHYTRKESRVCIWTIHKSVLKGFQWQVYSHTIN